MKERMRRRVLGAMVLASLMVIFLPGLLEHPRLHQQQLVSIEDIPPQAAAITTTPSLLPNPDVEPLIPPLSNNPEPPPATEVAKVETVPPVVENSTSEVQLQPQTPIQENTPSWVVQVASFKAKDMADRLQKNLADKGFNAYVEQKKSRARHKVYVGPFAEQTQANEKAAAIKQQLNLSCLVRRYPVN
ncbi:hypothetical protein TI04_06125 [Achromatium sp. WMS2]|nr:hypothetical protein TI04_06125 [Achromatium sp. WMS2]